MERNNGRHKPATMEPGHYPGPGADNGRCHRDVALPPPASVTACDLHRFGQAYRLSEAIEAGVKTGRCHWRDKAGRLLGSWGEVVRAIMADDIDGVEK